MISSPARARRWYGSSFLKKMSGRKRKKEVLSSYVACRRPTMISYQGRGAPQRGGRGCGARSAPHGARGARERPVLATARAVRGPGDPAGERRTARAPERGGSGPTHRDTRETKKAMAREPHVPAERGRVWE